jgi:hypothetical protein
MVPRDVSLGLPRQEAILELPMDRLQHPASGQGSAQVLEAGGRRRCAHGLQRLCRALARGLRRLLGGGATVIVKLSCVVSGK